MHASPGSARAFLAVACSLVLGCAAPDRAPARALDERPLRLIVRSPVDTLDPQRSNDYTTSALLTAVYEPLVELDERLRPQPGLAVSWRTPTDERWHFELRQDSSFHDGQPLLARHVVETIRRGLTQPESREGWKLARVAEVGSTGRQHVDVVTRGPAPLLLAGLTEVLVTAGEPQDAASANGTGPYRVESWDGAALRLRAVDRPGRPRPDFDRVEVRPLADARARVAEVLAGRADLAEFPLAEDLDAARRSPLAQVVTQPSLALAMLGFRVSPGSAFADVRVRRALAALIDRDAAVREAVRGHGRPAFHWAPHGTTGFFEPLRAPALAPESARRELHALLPRGLRAPLLHVDRDRALAALLQRSFATAGVALELVELDWPELDRRLADGRAPSWLMQFSFSSGDAADLLNDGLHSRTADGRYGLVNFSGLADPTLDRLIESAAAEMDHGLRLGLLEQAGRQAASGCTLIPLFEANTLYVTSRRVRLPAEPGGRLRPQRIRRASPD